MKYLKLFEELTIKPKIGDWVKITLNPDDFITINDKYLDFINNNYGKIVYIHKWSGKDTFIVSYKNVPYLIDHIFDYSKEFTYHKCYTKEFLLKDIVEFAKNKKELDLKIKTKELAKKYNIL
jgi:predicted KAP-like P-loop ATPase